MTSNRRLSPTPIAVCLVGPSCAASSRGGCAVIPGLGFLSLLRPNGCVLGSLLTAAVPTARRRRRCRTAGHRRREGASAGFHPLRVSVRATPPARRVPGSRSPRGCRRTLGRSARRWSSAHDSICPRDSIHRVRTDEEGPGIISHATVTGHGQPVVKAQLYSTGAVSRLASLLLGHILPVFSLVAPCQPGTPAVSVQRWTSTTGC